MEMKQKTAKKTPSNDNDCKSKKANVKIFSNPTKRGRRPPVFACLSLAAFVRPPMIGCHCLLTLALSSVRGLKWGIKIPLVKFGYNVMKVVSEGD